MNLGQIKDWVGAQVAPHGYDTLDAVHARVVVQHDDQLCVDIHLSYPCGDQGAWCEALAKQLRQTFGCAMPVEVTVKQAIRARAFGSAAKRHAQVRNVIAVGAGKGGVGKSTVAVRMTEALSALGASVGLLDADVYGPNVAHLLGQKSPGESAQTTDLKPAMIRGMAVLSLGQWVARSDAIAWRGPMVGKVLEQMYHGADWPDLDYLIVDLPPGTGDAIITMGKKLPLTAAIVVTTPQTVACMDAQKAVSMFEKMQVPVLGFVNNMSRYQCEVCHHEQKIFMGLSESDLADMLQVPCLVDLPLQQQLALCNEQGAPLDASQHDATLVDGFAQLARQVTLALCSMKKDYSLNMPKVEVQQLDR